MNAYFTTLANYDYWANLNVLATYISHASPPERACELMSHLVAAQRIWLDRLQGIPQQVAPWQRFQDDTLLDLLELNQNEALDFIQNTDLQQLIHYTNSEGKVFVNTVEQVLTHVYTHASYHRGQLMQLLKQPDVPLPETSFIVYSR